MTKSPRMIALLFLTCVVGGVTVKVQAQTEPHSVQVASYLNTADAQAEVNRLRAKKLDAYWVKAEIPGMGTRYRVRIGRFSNENDATLGAAQACKTRSISQYLVATGDNVPTGVPAKTCKTALAAAARLNPAPDVSAPAASSQTRTTSIAKNPKPTTPPSASASPAAVVNYHPEPVTTPKTPNKAAVKPAPATSVINPAPTAEPKPATKNQTPNVATKASPVAVTTAEPSFAPAALPGDIVTRAYKYATEKAGRAPKVMATAKVTESANTAAPTSVNAMIARATPGLTSEVAIANPKWKVSQANVASDKNLRAVHFVDATTGWAAGDGGTIYQTLDGGKQWNPIRNATLAGTVIDVNRIYFINENKGWMLGETREGEEGRTVLLSTDDGGKIWQNFEMPNVTSFYFVDGKKGWAVGRNATMLRTTDGGLRWKPIENLNRLVGLPVESAASKFGFSDVFFLKGGEVGWAVGNFYGVGTTNIGGLFMTSDGGENWQRIPIAVQRKTNSTRFTRGKLHTVRFTDVSNGVITGEMEDGDEHFFFTLKTRNGGETWEQSRVPSSGIHSTAFVDAARGWTAASALREGSAEAKVYDTILLRTDNGGKSWVTDFVAKGKQIRSVFFISPTRGWAVGDRGMILRYEATK
ncbi:MAG TPA: YCF48-related protein [Blastocatellia bacterium]|nr:YCF48-related protein [Blastocatellia bacterium]